MAKALLFISLVAFVSVAVAQNASCFPGDATVEMYNGDVKFMRDLSVGDKVTKKLLRATLISTIGLPWARTSTLTFTHLATTTQTRLRSFSRSGAIPTLSSSLLATSSPPTWKENLYTNAPKSSKWETLSGDHLRSAVEKLGLYNPLTLSGSIVVNNVLASVHSEWFLDSIFDAVGASEYLPYAYQTLLAPARAMCTLVGRDIYAKGYAMIDSYVNVAEMGLKHGGSILMTAGIAGVAATLFASKAKAN